MHYTMNVNPLLVSSLSEPIAIALLPVPLLPPHPSSDSKRFAEFYKPSGKLIPLHPDDALRVRKYMQRHNTECLTSDGQIAFTLHGNQLMQCEPRVCGQPEQQLYVNFHPQYWLGDCAMAAGPAERVDVTEKVLSMSAQALQAIRDGSPSADALVDPEDRAHYGPYTVTCEAALREFFGVNCLSEISEKLLNDKKAGQPPPARRTPPELDAESVWMMAVGPERVFFTCRATSLEDALDQTHTAFPGKPISAACAIA